MSVQTDAPVELTRAVPLNHTGVPIVTSKNARPSFGDAERYAVVPLGRTPFSLNSPLRPLRFCTRQDKRHNPDRIGLWTDIPRADNNSWRLQRNSRNRQC